MPFKWETNVMLFGCDIQFQLEKPIEKAIGQCMKEIYKRLKYRKIEEEKKSIFQTIN